MEFKNGIPVIKKGLELSQISFSGGRVAASIANHGGLTHVDYYGRQRLNAVTLFRADAISAWAQLFRVCVQIGEELYELEYNDTRIYPFGFESRCRLDGVDLRHKLTLLNDALVFEVEVDKNPRRKRIAAKLVLTETGVRQCPSYRKWGEFAVAGNEAMLSIIDTYPQQTSEPESLTQVDAFGVGDAVCAETFVGVTSDRAFKLTKTPSPGVLSKVYFSTEHFTDSVTLTVAFGHDSSLFKKRLRKLRSSASEEAREVRARFLESQRNRPKIQLGDETVDSMLAVIGGVVDSLKIPDLPGAIRAADSSYWVWGWDSMVHSDAMMLYQDADGVRDMLRFYRTLSHPKLGIPHAITLAGQPLLAMAFPAQCLYCVMLYNAYLFTGELELLREFYPFAKSLVLRAAATEVENCGLIPGVGYYPDFPEHLDQDGKDFSIINNGIFYQALRVMEQLAVELKFAEDAEDFEQRAKRLRQSFGQFFDAKKGYFYDSLSSKDLTPRKHYPLYAILWVTPFAGELVRGKESRIAKFMSKNFAIRHGLRMFPTWDTSFMKDGNQLGAYMPVIENFYRQMMATAGKPQTGDSWRENVAWFWKRLTLPEAFTAQFANYGAALDNPGRKQAFCAKAWYSVFFHTVAGLDFDLNGIQFSPTDSGDIEIKKLTIRGKKIDLRIQGRGYKVGSLKLNGKEIGKTGFIPYGELKKTNRILLKRTA